MNTYVISYSDPNTPFLKGKIVKAKNLKNMLKKAEIDEAAIEGVIIRKDN